MANISEKAISILAGNLNLGHSYLITTVFSFFLGKTKLAIWIYDEIKKVVHNKSSNGHVRQKRNWFIFLRQHQRDRIITIFLEVVHPTVSKAGQDKMQPHEFHTASYVQCHSIYILEQ